MNVIQTVMRGWDGHDSARCSKLREAVPLLKIPHEVRNALAGRRKVTIHRIIVFGPQTPLARGHHDFTRFVFEGEHRQGSVPVELVVNSLDESSGCRAGQSTLEKHMVDFCLHSDMRRRFDLQVATFFILIQLAR